MNLVDRGRPFGAKSPAARRMHGIAFELRDLPGFLVDISQQAACGFAIETDRRNQGVMLLDPARPGFGVKLNPVLPLLHGRTVSQVAPVAVELIAHSNLSKR